MKVEGPKGTQNTSSTKKKGGVSKGDSTFGDMLADKVTGSQGTSATQSIAKVDALLAVQETESATERAARRRMTKRGDEILDELENIRMGLLTGNLTVGHVIDVADVIASHREKITDPNLTALLDEIDLRAQVEIAKMRMALDNNA